MSVRAKDRSGHTPSPMTARELLASVAGDEHALHSVVAVMPNMSATGSLAFRCSCGAICFVLDVEANRLALQNVVREAA